MEKLALLKKVLNDYCADSEENKFQTAILSKFCDYAENWLRQNGVVGLGHTAEGLALRLSDGAEYLLFAPDPHVAIPDVSVSIAGTASKIEKPVNDFTRSFPITGR